MTLQRLVLENPGTKARSREVQDLTREDLRQALASLEGSVQMVGTSGYEVREDTISAEKAA